MSNPYFSGFSDQNSLERKVCCQRPAVPQTADRGPDLVRAEQGGRFWSLPHANLANVVPAPQFPVPCLVCCSWCCSSRSAAAPLSGLFFSALFLPNSPHELNHQLDPAERNPASVDGVQICKEQYFLHQEMETCMSSRRHTDLYISRQAYLRHSWTPSTLIHARVR